MKKVTFTISTFLILLILVSCADKSIETANYSNAVSEEKYSVLDNRLQGWGYRKMPERPEFTSQQINYMNKYGCIYMGNDKEKNLYLTFDEGYENGYTAIILDVLREKNVPAAFFVTGPYVKQQPELILRMVKEGHVVGNHTVNHPSMPSLVTAEKMVSELTELDRLVYDVCKKHCQYFRPPKGEYSERTLAVTKDLGYTSTFWSFAYVDWKNDVSPKQAEESVGKGLHNGAVLLLHAVSKGNADALGNIIDDARKKGYEFKSLDEYSA